MVDAPVASYSAWLLFPDSFTLDAPVQSTSNSSHAKLSMLALDAPTQSIERDEQATSFSVMDDAPTHSMSSSRGFNFPWFVNLHAPVRLISSRRDAPVISISIFGELNWFYVDFIINLLS